MHTSSRITSFRFISDILLVGHIHMLDEITHKRLPTRGFAYVLFIKGKVATSMMATQAKPIVGLVFPFLGVHFGNQWHFYIYSQFQRVAPVQIGACSSELHPPVQKVPASSDGFQISIFHLGN